MARDPGSVWAPLPEAGAPDGYEKTQFIVHSTGDNGTAAATRRFFAGATLNESTFIVGQGPWDPTLQIMDSTDVADANGSANRRGISVEVAGDGVGGYNAWQRSELVRLGRWARAAHPGILPRIIPAHTEPGFGWHVMFGAPGPWAGVAKVCPGKQRIKELQTDIFPAIFAGTPLSEEDDFMSALSPERQVEVAAKIDTIHRLLTDDTAGKDRIGDVYRAVESVGKDAAWVKSGVDRLVGAVNPGVDGGGPNSFSWVVGQILTALAQQGGGVVSAEDIAAAIPPDIAEQVAANLAARLAS